MNGVVCLQWLQNDQELGSDSWIESFQGSKLGTGVQLMFLLSTGVGRHRVDARFFSVEAFAA